MTSISEKSRISLGIVGAILILLFPFLPIPTGPMVDEFNRANSVYLYGRTDQYGTLILAPLTVLCIYRHAWSWAISALIGIFLCTASAYVKPPVSSGWGYANPGFWHAVTMFSGLILLGLSIFSGWATTYSLGTNKTIQLSASPSTKAKSSVTKPSGSYSFSLPSPGDIAGSIDWRWWGILILSFIAWPIGVLLHFAFSRSGDDKADAAIIGAGLGLGLMVLRFVLSMAKVGGTS